MKSSLFITLPVVLVGFQVLMSVLGNTCEIMPLLF
jgi:hypothetical protein